MNAPPAGRRWGKSSGERFVCHSQHLVFREQWEATIELAMSATSRDGPPAKPNGKLADPQRLADAIATQNTRRRDIRRRASAEDMVSKSSPRSRLRLHRRHSPRRLSCPSAESASVPAGQFIVAERRSSGERRTRLAARPTLGGNRLQRVWVLSVLWRAQRRARERDMSGDNCPWPDAVAYKTIRWIGRSQRLGPAGWHALGCSLCEESGRDKGESA